MITNIHLLPDIELQHLFLAESKRFTDGMDNGMNFMDLKRIRINLRGVDAEKERRKFNPLDLKVSQIQQQRDFS